MELFSPSQQQFSVNFAVRSCHPLIGVLGMLVQIFTSSRAKNNTLAIVESLAGPSDPAIDFMIELIVFPL